MKTSAMLKLATVSMIIGTTMVGCSTQGQASRPANASDRHAEQVAAKASAKARTALAKKKYDVAIAAAEAAVAASPRNAGYRMLLAQAYLGAGRFASAEAAFGDVLTLTPDNGRAALNLALVEVARGKKEQALSTLSDYRDKIAGVDYGLATALAGDTREAIRVLEMLARDPAADARVRQNLALAYALDGQWAPARTMASVDLTEADADARLLQWAAFARPDGAQAQVATLLGVSPAANDLGQPSRLALAPTNPAVQTAMAEQIAAPVPAAAPAPVPAPAPVEAAPAVPAPVADTPAPAFEVAPAPAPVRVAAVEAPRPAAPLIRAAAAPARQMVVPAVARTAAAKPAAARPLPVEAGKFVVQLGAFENAAVSRDAWNRLAPRYNLGGYEPANASARVGNANFVRLSVGGFASRDAAKSICTRIQAAGGKCFVRSLLGDQVASWVKRGPVQRFAKAPAKPAKPVRVASR